VQLVPGIPRRVERVGEGLQAVDVPVEIREQRLIVELYRIGADVARDLA
jgi:hypothetical protein